MSETEDKTSNEKKYPSVKLAYPLAISSYEELRRSRDSIHNVLTSLLSIALSAMLAVPLVVKAFTTMQSPNDPEITGGCLIAAVFVFALLSCSCCLAGRLMYKNPMIDPKKLFEKKLHLSKWTFKKDMIHEAGEAFKKSSTVQKYKWRWAVAAIVFVSLEVLALGLWVIVSL